MENEATVSKNFIEQIIEKDLAEGHCKTVKTRFPPEPNGYLHIGHAKSILLNYGLAKKYDGQFNLRFDDTNPTKERLEFVESIEADVKWLGADWADRKFFASNYFDKMYECAVGLIKKGKAYVSDLTPDEIREYRGTLTEAGKEDPYSKRSVEENLDLFERMKNGEFEDGTKVLRARIDMSSSNINMRDPILYRVAHMTHHNTGDKWCVYPMYDFAVKVGGDCLMLIWQHFGKKEVYYIISAALGEDIIERSLGDMDGFVEHLEEYRIAGKNYRTHISLWDTLE